MHWFINLTTRSKLIICFGVVGLILIGVVSVGYVSMVRIQERQETLLRVESTAFELMRLDRNLNEQRALMLAMFVEDDPQVINEMQESIERIDQLINTSFAELEDLTSAHSTMSESISQLEEIVTQQAQLRDERILPAMGRNNVAETEALTLGAQQDRYQEIRTLADDLSSLAAGEATEMVTSSKRIVSNAIILLVIAAIVAVLIIGLAVGLLNRVIAGPLNEVTRVAENITKGNLQVSLPLNDRLDEVGVLVASFGRMTRSLQELADVAEQIARDNFAVEIRTQSEHDVLALAFRSMVRNIQEMTTEIQDAVNVLSSSASEILASTSQASSSTHETATAISQISTTIDEVRQTAEVSSDKAQHVSDVAQRSNEIAQRGKVSVDNTVGGMAHIRSQMDSIAQNMLRLSEQSQAIGEIVATVAGLSEQSNLLAVNASIEAAKAGEQGKGFSVVAQEIRSLAEQSKDATSRVRNILNDIQQAISTTGMATEEGMKAVESGEKQSDETGSAIELLVNTIGECAQSATQIAASSQQQLTGMEQVASAMDNIREASNQSVAATKQTEEAARNLHELGQKLKLFVDRFETREETPQLTDDLPGN